MDKKEIILKNKTVFRLGLVSFFADISSEMLYPITPIFLTSVLGASMASLGVIEGIAEAIASLLKTYSGYWSDKIEKRKPFMIFGYGVAALSKPIIGLATIWPHVLFARALDRTGKGFRSAPRDALLAEAIAPEQRGAAFGWHRAMDTLGAALGPLLAILLLSWSAEDLRSLYIWALIPGLIATLIIFSVREKNPTYQRAQKFSLNLNQLSPEFKKYLAAWGVFSIVNSSDVFLIMKAKQSGISLQESVLMYCFYNLFYSLMSPYLGHLSDKWGRKYVLAFGLGVFSLVYFGFSFCTSQWQFWFLFSIYGVYMAASDGVGKAFAVDLVPSHLKATGVGILGTVTGFTTIFASIIAGVLWDQVGAQWTFIYGALGALLAMMGLLSIKQPAKQ